MKIGKLSKLATFYAPAIFPHAYNILSSISKQKKGAAAYIIRQLKNSKRARKRNKTKINTNGRNYLFAIFSLNAFFRHPACGPISVTLFPFHTQTHLHTRTPTMECWASLFKKIKKNFSQISHSGCFFFGIFCSFQNLL